jgi:ribonuclease BN (tRNA processing enzyme)
VNWFTASGPEVWNPCLPWDNTEPRMGQVRVRVLGCGDAFGSGGRFQTCFMVAAASGCCLIDCGATAMVAMRRFDVDPGSIDTVFISHLHGDHFAGLPFLLLQQQFIGRRDRPLRIAGPPGTRLRLLAALDVMFPGSAGMEWGFVLDYAELTLGHTERSGPFAITPFSVVHPSGAPAFAFRLEVAGRTIAYSGDTEWTDTLTDVGRGADLLISECYAFDGQPQFHLDYKTLQSNLRRLGAKRVLLTHMGEEMLAKLDQVKVDAAEDGQLIEL